MTYSSWIDEDEQDEDPYEGGYAFEPEPRSRLLQVVIAGAAVLCVGAAAATAAAIISGEPSGDVSATAPVVETAVTPVALAVAPRPVYEISSFRSSGAIDMSGSWMFVARADSELRRLGGGAQTAALPPAEPLEASRSVPLPAVNPLVASGAVARASLTDPSIPLPMARPRVQMAALSPSNEPLGTPAPLPAPAAVDEQGVAMPTPGSGFALYDIAGKVVYMPTGEKLEAHSGFGDMFDDPRFVHKKMVGPTPPNTYRLAPREALFHGVEALRMHPVGGGKMYGRDGFLTHTYLLGARGDSNGCVSFKDYDKFLAAYKRGEVQRLVVVASLPKKDPPPNPLISWLMSNGKN